MAVESATPVPQAPESSQVLSPESPVSQGFPVIAEGFASESVVAPEPTVASGPVGLSTPVVASSFSELPVAPKAPIGAPIGGSVTDPVKITKLNSFAQRIATTARGVLPPHHHGMVNELLTEATRRVNAGEGPEAVKNLALTISRASVDAGCDAEMVKNLNAQIKALFSK